MSLECLRPSYLGQDLGKGSDVMCCHRLVSQSQKSGLAAFWVIVVKLLSEPLFKGTRVLCRNRLE